MTAVRIRPEHVRVSRIDFRTLLSLVSARRVDRYRKGTLSAKRRHFMELRARGWGIRAAVREVGVSPAARQNWAGGYTL